MDIIHYEKDLNIENNNDREKYIGKIFKNKLFGEYIVLGVYDNLGNRTGNKRYIVKFLDTGFETLALGHHILKGAIKDNLKPIIYNNGYFGYIDNVKHNPFYRVWMSMLQRCYDEKLHKKEESYKNCIVDEKWKCFQLFLEDIPSLLGYDYIDKYKDIKFQLDKDIKFDTKTYNLDSCIFIPQKINNFFTNEQKTNTTGFSGVSYKKSNEKYVAYTNRNGKKIHLGYFNDALEAYNTYMNNKKIILEDYLNEFNFLGDEIKKYCRDKLARQYSSTVDF